MVLLLNTIDHTLQTYNLGIELLLREVQEYVFCVFLLAFSLKLYPLGSDILQLLSA